MTVPAFLLGRNAALAAVALALLAIAGVAAFLLGPALAGEGSSGDAIRQLAMLHAEAAALPQMSRALSMLKDEAKSQPSFLQGDRDAAQASLQGEVKAIVAANGGEVRSSYVMPPSNESGLPVVAVQYDLMAPASKLRPLIYAIESHVPYFFISGVELVPPQTWTGAKEAPEPRIEVRWTVSAYRRSGK
jgi:hypothetical protein